MATYSGNTPPPDNIVLSSDTIPPTPAVCGAIDVLGQIDELLIGRTFEAHYLTTNRELTLSIWMVDPEIDPQATADNLLENNQRAARSGLMLFQEIIEHIPCIREVFVNANPMIVDRLYQGWYRDVIPIHDFPQKTDHQYDNLVNGMLSSNLSYGFQRNKPPQPEDQVRLPDACTWSEARAAIEQNFGPERRNTAAYIIIDAPDGTVAQPEGVLVEVQWDVQNATDLESAAILQNLDHVAEALSCLWPPVDQVETFIVDAYGQLMVFAAVPGSLIREGKIPLPPDRVLLEYMNEQEWWQQ